MSVVLAKTARCLQNGSHMTRFGPKRDESVTPVACVIILRKPSSFSLHNTHFGEELSGYLTIVDLMGEESKS